jgi:hypothetical protein
MVDGHLHRSACDNAKKFASTISSAWSRARIGGDWNNSSMSPRPSDAWRTRPCVSPIQERGMGRDAMEGDADMETDGRTQSGSDCRRPGLTASGCDRLLYRESVDAAVQALRVKSRAPGESSVL